MRIQAIVEGAGERLAVPTLLSRLATEAGIYDLRISEPLLLHRNLFERESELRRMVRLARGRSDGILILFDADNACPKDLAPVLGSWARAEAAPVPCELVMALKEYEAWFLGAMESLRGRCGIRQDAVSHPSPELPRGCKAQIERWMEGVDATYSPTIHQKPLTAQFDLAAAYRGCRSFRRLIHAFGELASAIRGKPFSDWPPPTW